MKEHSTHCQDIREAVFLQERGTRHRVECLAGQHRRTKGALSKWAVLVAVAPRQEVQVTRVSPYLTVREGIPDWFGPPLLVEEHCTHTMWQFRGGLFIRGSRSELVAWLDQRLHSYKYTLGSVDTLSVEWSVDHSHRKGSPRNTQVGLDAAWREWAVLASLPCLNGSSRHWWVIRLGPRPSEHR